MSRATILKLALPAAAILSSLAFTSPATVGPPWISLEMPANPMDATTRGAALVIRTFHHEYPAGIAVTGTAEGLVNGERRSLDLEFRVTSNGGVYALDPQWPAEGHWILNITTGAHADVSLVVELGPEGGVKTGTFYEWPVTTVALRSARVVEGELSAAQLDAAVRALAAGE